MKQWLAVAFVLVLGTGMILAEKKTLTITIRPLEGKAPPVVLFNPTELKISKSVPWQKSKTPEQLQEPVLEFTSADSTVVSFETAFDTTATDESVYRKYIEPMENLTKVDEDLKRPPMVLVIWGPQDGSVLPKFQGVIESMATRYTMFSTSGTPVRATTNVTMKSASKAKTRSEENPEH